MISLENRVKLYNHRNKITVIVCIAILLLIISSLGLAVKAAKDKGTINLVPLPDSYDSTYTESLVCLEEELALEEQGFDSLDSETLKFLTVTVTETSGDTAPKLCNSRVRTKTDEEIIMLPENDAWSLISNGYYTSYPQGSFNDNRTILSAIQQQNTQTITVPCWYWANPGDEYDLTKISTTKTFAVNSAIAPLFEHAFRDIYNDPSQPVLNLGDGGMGTWVLRGKNHNDNARMSTHALGCCIDINPSTGSFKINDKWYGNGYGHDAMPYDLWTQLPESHTKYQVLYVDCPIVQIFKSYGFVWGGDWSSTKDCMHLSFIGEGANCRQQGQQNYKEY